jgi:1,4-alpha-glucan branching enzyme
MNRMIESLLQARLSDPFGLLGLHRKGAEWLIRVYEPHATGIELLNNTETAAFKRIHPAGVFEWRGENEPARPYRLRIHNGNATHEIFDPYQFPPHISQQDLYLFSEGKLRQGYRMLGSHAIEINGVKGMRFAVWAPNAERVSVVGEFNSWDGRITRCARLAACGAAYLEYGGMRCIVMNTQPRHRTC